MILARGTPGFSGADLANLVNEAALNAARHGQKVVKMHDFEEAKDKVMMGAERRSMIMSAEEKRTTAYHEAGHALVAAFIKDSDPIHKVTIIPRGMALGVTMLLPETDKLSHDKKYVEARIAVAMGGRLAEELVLDQLTTGAHDDLEKATELARKMVCEWGMSEKMGPLTFGRKEEQVFLGRDIARHQDYSEDTAVRIDQEVKRIVSQGYERAKAILSDNRTILANVAEALLEREVLDAEDVKAIIDGLPLKERERRSDEVVRDETEAKGTEKERSASLTPPILQNPGSVPQS
jgi:cell division protease FtsH